MFLIKKERSYDLLVLMSLRGRKWILVIFKWVKTDTFLDKNKRVSVRYSLSGASERNEWPAQFLASTTTTKANMSPLKMPFFLSTSVFWVILQVAKPSKNAKECYSLTIWLISFALLRIFPNAFQGECTSL